MDSFRALGLFGVVTGLLVTSCGSEDAAPAGRCPGFNACGGDLSGVWNVVPEATCVEGNLASALNLNPNSPAACHGAYQSVQTQVEGTVSFSAGTAVNDTVTTAVYDILVDAACASALGVADYNETTCASNVGTGLVASGLHQGATCVMQADGCRCTARDQFERAETLQYTTSGSTLNYTANGTVAAQPMDFCVIGNELSARQFTTELLSTVFFKATRAVP